MSDKKTYHTKQQDTILETFREHPDTCYTARQLLTLLSDTRIGEATIYRSLQRLTDAGLIQKFAPAAGNSQSDNRLNQACYQYTGGQNNCKEHFHLKCLKCGSVIHMDCSFMEEINRHIAEEHHFTVDNSQTTIYGLCQQCAESEQNKGESPCH